MVRTWDLHSWGPGLMPAQGTEILQARQQGQKKKKKMKFLNSKGRGAGVTHLDIKDRGRNLGH